MKNIRITAVAAAFVTLGALSACSGYGGGSAEADFDSLKAQAMASLNEAKAAGFEWRDSGKLIEKAEAAYKEGKVESAISLLKQAEQQGQLALVQAKDQADAAMKN